MILEEFSLVPKDYKKKDPRALLYLYPETINYVAYAKRMQIFSFYQSLEIVEDLAKRQGYLLLPWTCIHWNRAKNFGPSRKVKIGRKSFFMLKPTELTKSEKMKREGYLEEIEA